MTAEDPVEYNLKGVNQVQVNEGIGRSFAAALRAFLRQDPDVILVGETRDLEIGPDRHPGRPHRPPRADHPAHQRLPRPLPPSPACWTWASPPSCGCLPP